MVNEIENLKHVIHVNEEEIKCLKSKCEQCEKEELETVDEFKHAQVMSKDQLEKLYYLAKKQDLLEVETSIVKECLQQSDVNNKELGQSSKILKHHIIKLHSENANLMQIITEKEIHIQKLKDEQGKYDDKQSVQNEKLKKDYEKQLKLKQEEIEELKQEIKRLDKYHSDCIKQFHAYVTRTMSTLILQNKNIIKHHKL